MRLIPTLGSKLNFNIASLWAFFSIVMTSYGVNYYLAGLHSYAKGDPLPVPTFVYWIVSFVLLLTFLAIKTDKKRKSVI